MSITGPRGLLVPGPVIQPARYGLLSVVQGPTTPGDVHWEAGLEFEDVLCGAPVATGLAVCSGTGNVKTPQGGPTFRSVDPFVAIGSYNCSTGGRPAQQAFDIAKARLLANEYKAVETAFWTGETPDGPLNLSLANGDVENSQPPVDLTPAGGPVSVVGGLGLLESALGDCLPGTGVIHANYGVAPYFAEAFLIRKDPGEDTYYTPTGQAIAFGAGYPGTGPANVAADAGTTWLFGTGQVIAWRSDVFMTPDTIPAAVDRQINDITVFAERNWAVAYMCCLFAVNVALSCDCS